MSWQTDVILLLNSEETWVEESGDYLPEEVESDALNAVNAWLKVRGYGELLNLGDLAFPAGKRAMQSLVYGGAFRRLDDEEFARVVLTQSWRSPENVQLLTKAESETRYVLHTALPQQK